MKADERERLGKVAYETDYAGFPAVWEQAEEEGRERHRVVAEAVARVFLSDLFMQEIIDETTCAAIRSFLDAPAEGRTDG